jgi:hypothetical protein
MYYVVYVIPPRDDSPRKAFEHRAGAEKFATSQCDHETRAEIYETACTNARAAIAAVEMGEGTLIGTRETKASPQQLRDHTLRDLL